MSRRNSRNALNSREPSAHSAPVSVPLFVRKTEVYGKKLELLENSSEGLLAVLLIRDQLQNAMSSKAVSYPDDALQRLVKLDQRLSSIILKAKNIQWLPEYRKTFSPAEEHWWWYIDQEALAQEERKDLRWNLGALLMVTVSSALTMEIIKRLWVGTPDTISFFGTVLSVALTSSAFTEQGREIGERLLKRIPQVQGTARAEAKFVMAVIAALLVLGIWSVGVPHLARCYHNKGVEIKQHKIHMLTKARIFFNVQLHWLLIMRNLAINLADYTKMPDRLTRQQLGTNRHWNVT